MAEGGKKSVDWVKAKMAVKKADPGVGGTPARFKMENSRVGFEVNSEKSRIRGEKLGLLSSVPEECIKRGVLMKIGFGGKWHRRLCILTDDFLGFALEGSNLLIDVIPLLEIALVGREVESGIVSKLMTVVKKPGSAVKSLSVGIPSTQGTPTNDATHNDHDGEADGTEEYAKESNSPPDAPLNSAITAAAQLNSTGKQIKAKGSLTISSLSSTTVDTFQDRDCFHLITHEDGFNAGRIYYLRASEDDSNEWINAIRKQRMLVKRKAARERNIFIQLQRILTKWYRHPWTEAFFASAIILNFMSNIAEAEIDPRGNSHDENVFRDFEGVFVVIFTIELAWQAVTLWFWGLFGNVIFWGDVAVVAISLAAAVKEDLIGGVATIRAIRIIRILRLFQRLESLRVITLSLIKSIPRVGVSVLVMVFVSSIYAVFGVNLFGSRSEYFEVFSSAMFTLFQTCTSDGWASGIARTIRDEGSDDPAAFFWVRHDVSIFFVSYYILMVWVLTQMVVAVILDQFMSMSHTTTMKEEQEKCFDKLGITALSHVPLEPLLQKLIHFQNLSDLNEKLTMIFTVIDTNQTGRITPRDLSIGFAQLTGLESGGDVPAVVHFSTEDFEAFSHDYSLCDADMGMHVEQFKQAMKREMWQYLQRSMQTSLATVDEQMQPLVLALKMIINDLKQTAEENNLSKRMDRMEETLLEILNLVGGRRPPPTNPSVGGGDAGGGSRRAGRRREEEEGTSHGSEVLGGRGGYHRARATMRGDAMLQSGVLPAADLAATEDGGGGDAIRGRRRRRSAAGKLPPIQAV